MPTRTTNHEINMPPKVRPVTGRKKRRRTPKLVRMKNGYRIRLADVPGGYYDRGYYESLLSDLPERVRLSLLCGEFYR